MKKTLTLSLLIIGNLVGAVFYMIPGIVVYFGVVWSWLIGFVISLTFSLIFSYLYPFFPSIESFFKHLENLEWTIFEVLFLLFLISIDLILISDIFNFLKIDNFYYMLFCIVFMVGLTLINFCFHHAKRMNIHSILLFIKIFFIIWRSFGYKSFDLKMILNGVYHKIIYSYEREVYLFKRDSQNAPFYWAIAFFIALALKLFYPNESNDTLVKKFEKIKKNIGLMFFLICLFMIIIIVIFVAYLFYN